MLKRLLLIFLLVTIICVPTAIFIGLRVERRLVLAEAKNVEFALRLEGLNLYGQGRDIHDPYQPHGLAVGVEEEIQNLSGATGTIDLISWNDKDHVPVSLDYQSGRYLVRFTRDSKHEEDIQWNIWYHFR